MDVLGGHFGRHARIDLSELDLRGVGALQLVPASASLPGDRPMSEVSRSLLEWFGALAFVMVWPTALRGMAFACIMHGGQHAGRGGHGVLLAETGVRAIGVRGALSVPVADGARTVAIAKDQALPSCNFQASTVKGAEALSSEALQVKRERGRGSCKSCTIGCEHFFRVRPGEPPQKVEYENVFALGPLCGVSDPETVIEAARRCDELGMDTISTGATIAFAMECAERGLLRDPAWQGEAKELRFGNGPAMLEMIERIAHRRGPLADGTRRASRGSAPRRSGSRRTQRAWRSPATRRARSRQCRWASRSPRAAPITTAAAPTKRTSPARGSR
ncbi:aldehyde ferredoxin oxidoreductase C-terminal domain-containing protein [Sorangium sp. So ce216]